MCDSFSAIQISKVTVSLYSFIHSFLSLLYKDLNKTTFQTVTDNAGDKLWCEVSLGQKRWEREKSRTGLTLPSRKRPDSWHCFLVPSFTAIPASLFLSTPSRGMAILLWLQGPCFAWLELGVEGSIEKSALLFSNWTEKAPAESSRILKLLRWRLFQNKANPWQRSTGFFR